MSPYHGAAENWDEEVEGGAVEELKEFAMPFTILGKVLKGGVGGKASCFVGIGVGKTATIYEFIDRVEKENSHGEEE